MNGEYKYFYHIVFSLDIWPLSFPCLENNRRATLVHLFTLNPANTADENKQQ